MQHRKRETQKASHLFPLIVDLYEFTHLRHIHEL